MKGKPAGWFLWGLFALLGGCAALTPSPRAPLPDPARLAAFELEGRIAFSGAGERGSATLQWRQEGEAYRVRLHGPFGAGAAEIRGTPQRARLERPGEAPLTAPGGEALARALFGFPLPVEALPWWVRGVPAPHRPARVEAGPDGRRLSLEQEGWRIAYLAWGRFGAWQVPVRVRGEGPDGVQFRLVVHRFRPLAEGEGR